MKSGEGSRRTQPRIRLLRFYAVGGIGIGVQLLTLALLKSGLGLSYLAATALAVEAAIVHNYVWHERFTWSDRSSSRGLVRFLKFNCTTGAVSIAGNLVIMSWLVGGLHLPYLVANVITVAACSMLNFLVSDRWVFQV